MHRWVSLLSLVCPQLCIEEQNELAAFTLLDAECIAAYKENWAHYMYHSGMMTRFIPKDQRPKQFYVDIIDQMNKEIAPLEGSEFTLEDVGTDRWLRHLFSLASHQILACWGVGGRYWELDYEEFELQGMCVPWRCEHAEVLKQVVPLYMVQYQDGQFTSLGRGDKRQIEVRELSHWSRLKLDFAIVGLSGCGTSSLHQNLLQHPNISFTPFREDSFFTRGVGNKLLPLKTDEEQFNGQWLPSDGQRQIHGLKNAGLYENPIARHALAKIPNLKVIVIGCDFVSRFEKRVYFECRQDCIEFMSLASDKRSVLLAEQNGIADHLNALHYLFGARKLVIHQFLIRNNQEALYTVLAEFVGSLTGFPRGSTFGHYNVLNGPRTGLCANTSLVRVLQRRLKPAYSALEQMLSPPCHDTFCRTAIRKTRCQHPSDLSGPTRPNGPAWLLTQKTHLKIPH